ncbi:MAG: sigma factor-like helix-turn-helix DNA-binding protein [Candidatus Woesearchaeota archaeon]
MLTEKEIEVLKLRKSNLTQIEVAKKLGISQAAVSSFEKNALMKIDGAYEVLRIANKLKLKVVTLENK